jgi:aryl-alcohol dehydrogenase-like predicted oxidoreductase
VKSIRLGETHVSAVGLGFWQFGSREWGWDPDLGESAARQIVARALDLGVNFFDTAEIYGSGRSEAILARALGERRAQAFIATKVSPTHARRRRLAEAASASLRRLQTNVIDLYQLHWPNRLVPLSQTMAGMNDLRSAGKVRFVGVSNFRLKAWRGADETLGSPVITNQVHFSLVHQEPLTDLLPFAREQNRVIIAYSPLAQGLLGGRYGPGSPPSDFRSSQPRFSDAGLKRASPLLEALRELARGHGATPAQIALAWLLHVPNVIVIPGARDIAQLEANAAVAEIGLSEAEWIELQDLGLKARADPTLRSRARRAAAHLLGW